MGKNGPVEPTDADWGRWIDMATSERVLPLLYKIVREGVTGLPREIQEAISQTQLDLMTSMVRFEHDLLEVTAILEQGGLRCAVLKGAATAHLDYPDPSLRQFGDVDLLVAPVHFGRARELLMAHGWAQAYPLPRHHERFTHAMTFRHGRRVEVDLHQRIGHRAIGELVPTEHLLHSVVEYDLAGRSLSALSAPDRLIHAALHSMTSRGPYRRLSSAADLILLTEAQLGEEAAVLSRAQSWKLGSLVQAGIHAAYHAAQLPIPHGWTNKHVAPGRWDSLVERAYLSDRRRPGYEELAYLRHLGGWRDRGDYVWGYFSTDAAYEERNRRSGLLDQSRYLWARLRSGRNERDPL